MPTLDAVALAQATSLRVLVVSDTHAPFRWRGAPAALEAALTTGPDLILHAGDACKPTVHVELSQYAPVLAVLGNGDGPDVRAWGAMPWLEVTLAGLPVAMLHDSGDKTGRAARMRRRFPDAALVVYGHSHTPVDAYDAATDLHLFNPGSATDPRRQPFGTFGWLTIEDGRLTATEILRAD